MRGNFYPENLPSKQFLNYYARQFDSVEVNSTFYGAPSIQTLMNWQVQTGAEFVFSIKFPRGITHVKRLRNCREETRFFLNRIELLGNKLGPLLFQFPPSFGALNLSALKKFLRELPTNLRYVVEVRNRKLLSESFYSILRDNNVALAWAESQKTPGNDIATSDFLYVRWEGDRRKVSGVLGRREISRNSELKFWARKLKLFLDSGYDVFGFFSKHFSGDAPADVLEFLSLLRSV